MYNVLVIFRRTLNLARSDDWRRARRSVHTRIKISVFPRLSLGENYIIMESDVCEIQTRNGGKMHVAFSAHIYEYELSQIKMFSLGQICYIGMNFEAKW
jgi:hypothetical protein